MLKFLLDAAILSVLAYVIYIKFFKKQDEIVIDPNAMIECNTCGIFIEQKDAIKQNSKTYCCELCAKKGA